MQLLRSLFVAYEFLFLHPHASFGLLHWPIITITIDLVDQNSPVPTSLKVQITEFSKMIQRTQSSKPDPLLQKKRVGSGPLL